MHHIIKVIFEHLQYIRKNKKGHVWVNPDSLEIEIDGGNMTMLELYKEVQKQLKDSMALDPSMLGDDNERN